MVRLDNVTYDYRRVNCGLEGEEVGGVLDRGVVHVERVSQRTAPDERLSEWRLPTLTHSPDSELSLGSREMPGDRGARCVQSSLLATKHRYKSHSTNKHVSDKSASVSLDLR